MKKNNIISKFVYVVIILLINTIMLGKVYAISECNITLKAQGNSFKKNDSFTVDVNMSNIKSEMGITAFGATIEYDHESLQIEKIEGQNEWETPTSGITFNTENGKIAITKSGFAKKNETIFRITFKVKEESKKNLSIILTDITASDGMELITVGESYTDITVRNGQANEKVRHENSKQKGGINIWIILLVIVLVIIVIVFFNKIRSKKHKSRR